MKTPSAACIFFALLFCSPCNAAEYVNLVIPPYPGEGPVQMYSQTVTLAAGDLAEIIYSHSGDNLEYQIGTDVFSVATQTGSQASNQPKVAGPATLRLSRSYLTSAATMAVVSITRANSPANAVPANAVVIPEDAAGEFQVVLESSTDLVTWTLVNPGTYSGSIQKRFFRTRIIRLN